MIIRGIYDILNGIAKRERAMNGRKIGKFSEAAWVLGMALLTLAVCLMTRASFGVSMVVSPAYVLHLALVERLPWFTFGTAEYLLQGVLLIVMCVAVRRFRWQYLLSFACAVLYGLMLDGWLAIFAPLKFDVIYWRIAAFAAGLVLTGISVAFFFRTYMPVEVYDLFITELCARYNFKSVAVKWIYDLSMLAVAVILALAFFGDLTGLGIGTLVCTVVNSPLIALFGKIEDRLFSFEPLLPSLARVIGRTTEGNGRDKNENSDV